MLFIEAWLGMLEAFWWAAFVCVCVDFRVWFVPGVESICLTGGVIGSGPASILQITQRFRSTYQDPPGALE